MAELLERFSETIVAGIDLKRAERAVNPAGIEVHGASGKPLRTVLYSRSDIEKIPATEWCTLAREALVENPFYARSYLLAALDTIDARQPFSILSIWKGDSLVGLFPLRTRFGYALGAQNVYQFSGTPLVHRECAEEVITAWLKFMRAGNAFNCWKLPNLQLSGALYELIRRVAGRSDFAVAETDAYIRPQLARLQSGFASHLTNVFGKSRRKEVERCMRRLREKGALRMERATSLTEVKKSLDVFMKMEISGWKGKSGTAFLSHPVHANFARAALTSEDAGGGTIVDVLLLDERPIAASVNITSGAVLFTPKCTYCESFRNLAPGLVLEYLVIERFYSDTERFVRMDAATLADGHVIQGLWNETVSVGTLYIGSPTKIAIALQLHRLKRSLKPKARRVRVSTCRRRRGYQFLNMAEISSVSERK